MPNEPSQSLPPSPAPPPPAERVRPWAQLKYFTFQPAIFPRLLGEVSPDARAGDLVTVYDKAGHRLGAGLYNPRAKIVLRVVAHGAEAVGGAEGEAYFEQAIRRAVALRRDVFRLDEFTDAYRLVNSDGDGLSGLTIDRYADTLFCDLYSLGMAQRLPRWLPLLHELAGTKFARVHVDHDLGSLEGIKPSVFNEANTAAPRLVKIREHGIRYEVDFAEGHKTGFFCDQRENRRALARLISGARSGSGILPLSEKRRDAASTLTRGARSPEHDMGAQASRLPAPNQAVGTPASTMRGARVLDLCCYTGGFSLSAKITGGADEVTSVDLDETAIAQARRNANLNQARLKFVHADAFAYARQMQTNGEKWDVVVLDPPKFIFTRDESGNWEGRQKYEDLNQLAISLVKPGGIFVTCSCSGLLSLEDFEQHVIKAAHRLNRRVQFFDRTGAGADHPVYSNCLESRYLKVLWGRVV